jgi:hypothetical protein
LQSFAFGQEAEMSKQYPPANLPSIHLTHGQATWVLARLGYADGVSPKTFNEYIKSLRKLGIPFERRYPKSRRGRRRWAHYGYFELMELAVTLSLRVYHAVPDSILEAIIHNRSKLRRIYCQAYSERLNGKGTTIALDISSRSIELRGCFLDLGIHFSGGRLIHFGPPKLLSPRQAIALSAQRMRTTQILLPLGLSTLAEKIVALALAAPAVRGGSQKNPTSKGRTGRINERKTITSTGH